MPVWARKAFNNSGPVTVQVSGAGVRPGPPQVLEQRSHLTLFLRDRICVPCNNRLGVKVERPASKLLKPMVLEAKPRELDPEQQALLATWATKTALLFEFAARQHWVGGRPQEGYEASEAEMAWLIEKLKPPPRSRVWIGAFDARNVINSRHEACLLHLPNSLDAHVTTLTVGYVAFQVYTINYVIAEARSIPEFNVMPENIEALLTRIWPTQLRTISWPGVAFTDSHWNSVTQWPEAVGQAVRLRWAQTQSPTA